ncbi:hypothetical protein DXZ79_13415 [Yersinia rochesterensis]|uniref:Uncharacterized protein n=1 Tax=Yersinia rochesterensis TaxID=1604335 RepID=A0A8D4SSR7_9GAMM|nr:hypothetical protein DXZ79_13415 [Yersinia rochesterensis]
MTNRSRTDLNAVCSGLAEARPMDGPSNESSQRTCSLKYDGHMQTMITIRRTYLPNTTNKATTSVEIKE